MHLLESREPEVVPDPRPRAWLELLAVLAAPVALLVYPIPSWVLVRSLALGIIVGCLQSTRLRVFQWAGLGVFCLGWLFFQEAAIGRVDKLGPMSIWGIQGLLVTGGCIFLVRMASRALRRRR